MDDYDIWGAIKCKILHIHKYVYDRQGDYILKTCVRCSKQKKKPLKSKNNENPDNHGSDQNRKTEQPG